MILQWTVLGLLMLSKAEENPFRSIQMGTPFKEEAQLFIASPRQHVFRLASQVNLEEIRQFTSSEFGPITSVDIFASSKFEIEGFVITRFNSQTNYQISELDGQLHLKVVEGPSAALHQRLRDSTRASAVSAQAVIEKLSSEGSERNLRILRALGFLTNEAPESAANLEREEKSSPVASSVDKEIDKEIDKEKDEFLSLIDEDLESSKAKKSEQVADAGSSPSQDSASEFVTPTKGIQFENEMTVPQFELPDEF